MSVSDGGKIPKSSFEIYRAEGDSLLRNADYPKAISCFTHALDLKPGDQHCLVSRSKCHLQEGQIEKALEDAEESLKEDLTYHKGLLQKAEVLYFKGDFENALVFYHRGHQLRPELQDFRLGIQKTEEAINNSVGENSSIHLRSDGDLTYFYSHEEKKKQVSRPSYQKPKKEDAGPKRAERKKPPANDQTIKKLLGELYADRAYLDKLLSNEERSSRKTEHSEKIRELCVEGLNYLDSRSEFWQQQKPMYARGKKLGADANAGKEQPVQYVLTNLEQIDEKQARGDHDLAIKQANHVLKAVENWTDKDLPNKQEVMANLHSLIGNSLLDLGKFDRSLGHHEKDLEIGKANNLEEAISRAMDNIGRVHARRGEYKKAIEIWEEKVPTARSPLEKTWLFHEIGRCYLEEGQAEKSRDYGEQALTAARDTSDDNWQLNSTVLIAQSEVKLEQYQEAISHFESALDIAKVLNNRQAEDAIVRAVEDVNQKILEMERERRHEEEQQEEQEKEQEETAAIEDTPAEEDKHDSPPPPAEEPAAEVDSTEQEATPAED